MKVLVSGGSGFIGGNVVRLLLSEGIAVVNLDALTYAAQPAALAPFELCKGYAFVHGDIRDTACLAAVFATHRPDAVIHLAAESHVDRSIDSPDDFITTNVQGTANLLSAALAHWQNLPSAQQETFRFLHVSTDEVFGALGPNDPPFTEDTPYAPRSPYAASKAASDHMVRAWGETYGLPVLISNSTNNYGPWQYPEKLIPLMLAKALDGERLPVYGRGLQVRDWLHVEDHAAALYRILVHGQVGRTYAVGARSELRNIDLVRRLCDLLDHRRPQHAPHDRFIAFVEDRPGHDARYAIDPSRLETELGWRPGWRLEHGLAATVDWYLANTHLWRDADHRADATRRRGVTRGKAAA